MEEQGLSIELLLAANDFKTSSTVNFPKKHPVFGDFERNQRHEPQATRLHSPNFLLEMGASQ